MSCSNPMVAVKTSFVNSETGKNRWTFLGSVKTESEKLKSYDSHFDIDLTMREDGVFWIPCDHADYGAEFYGYDHSFINGKRFSYKKYRREAVILPCGQCLECRTRYAAQWADRIVLEARYHEKSFFVTLTYDESHVPPVVDSAGNTNYTLQPKDLQDFVKRFRRQQEYYHDNQVRFYAVGEYGHLHHRPHYHIIVFGAVLDDLRPMGKSKVGTPLHTSETIEKLWQRGRVEVEPLSWESACYCARYTVKKLGKAETDFYDKLGIVPEFTRMSLKPAIGSRYLEDNMERIYRSDEILIPTTESVRHSKPPHYYDEKYDLIFPGQMAEIKENRKDVAKEALKLKMDRFSGSYLELLENEHQKFINNKPNLKRRNLE